MLRQFFEEQGRLPPESEEGSNVEYKLKLHSKDAGNPQTVLRFQHYVSQLAWRLSETGSCYYELGVDDTGTLCGVSIAELHITLKVLEEMCQETRSQIRNIERLEVKKGLWVAEVTIEKVIADPINQNSIGFQRRSVAFIGPSQIGKSTLISTLCSQSLDNPSGHNRLRLLRHRHEIISGKTSGISIDYLLFDVNGNCVKAEEDFGGRFDSQVAQNAPFVIQMVDLPGDPKYVKTVYAYLTQHTLDAVILYDYADSTKCSVFKEMLEKVKIPFFCVYRDGIDCSTGRGLEELKARLFKDLSSISQLGPFNLNCTVEFVVEHVYDGPEIGLVLSGLVTQGSFTCGQALFLMDQPVTIRSIHRMRQPVYTASRGQTVAITLQNSNLEAATILKGIMLTDKPIKAKCNTLNIAQQSLAGEGLVFIQGNRMAGSMMDDTLILSSSVTLLNTPQKYIFVRDDKITFGLCTNY